MMRFLLLAACLAFISPGRASPDLSSPATRIADAAKDPQWRGLFGQLAAGKNRWSRFEERRFFAFRRTPIVLTGEVRITADRGLSLHYLTPEPRTVIVDSRGLLIRDEHGRERANPGGKRGEAAARELVEVLRFDLARLQRDFELHGRRDATGWTLSLVPRSAASSAGSSIVIAGEGVRLRTIELLNGPDERIEIAIGETRDDVSFTADEWARYFR